MNLINEETQTQLSQVFGQLSGPVKLVMFSQDNECQYCRETRQLAQEVAALSDKISLEVYDFQRDRALAETYGVDKIPALVVARGGDEAKDYGIRYFGIPSGYEFSSLIEDVLMVSAGESGLSADTKARLASLDRPLHLQVFVTPTCPYCPQAVRLAHMLALESDWVQADMVEAIEFPHLSNKYQVMGVPRTVINETAFLEGAAPEALLLARVEEALA